MEKSEVSETVLNLVEIGLFASYILIGLAIVAAIILPLINSLSNPKSLLRGVFGLAFLGIMFLIGYSIATNERYQVQDVIVEGSLSQAIGGAIWATFFLMVISLLMIFWSEVSKIFR